MIDQAEGLDPKTPKLLPAPGTDPTGIALFCDSLVRENANDQRRLVFQTEAQRAFELYLGDHWRINTGDADGNGYNGGGDGDPIGSVEGARVGWWQDQNALGAVRYVLNRIQNCIISMMAIQAGDPPKVVFIARETGDPPVYYLNTNTPEGQQFAAMQFQADAAQGIPEPFDPTKPLPDKIAKPLLAQVQQADMLRQQAMVMGQPEPQGLMPEDLVIEVDHTSAIEARQAVFDGLWEDGNCQFHFSENVLNKNIFGVQPTTYEWDEQTKLPILTNVNPLQLFMDPIRSVGPRNTYTVYDEPISKDEALAQYPKFAKDIEDSTYFKVGTLAWPGSRSYVPGYRYTQVFYRAMGVIRHVWMRNQPYPMSPDEAMSAGHISLQNIPDQEAINAQQVQPSQPAPAEPNPAGAEAAEPQESTEGVDQDGVRAGAGGTGSGSGGEAIPANPPPVPTRQAFIHNQSGQELTPGAAGWPVRYGIRQIKIIGSSVVSDMECPFGDIPVAVNINLPIPFCPWGQGEPKRLEGVQMAINGLLSIGINQSAFNAYPPEVVAEQMMTAMAKDVAQMHSKPNQRYTVPQSVLETVQYDIKKLFNVIETPNLPSDFWKLLELLLKLIDQEGNQADVMQGEASAGWSGEVVKSLQTASSQVIRAKSMHTEFYIKAVVKLMTYSMCHNMTWQDWGRYCKKFPPAVLKAIYELNCKMEYEGACDISVSVQSGSGAAKAGKTQNLQAAAKSGAQVSPQTILESLELDPDQELQQTVQWQQKLAQLAPQISQAQPPVRNNPTEAGPPA